MMNDLKVGIIGCGNMGLALIRGLLKNRFIAPKRLIAWDLEKKILSRVVRVYGIQGVGSNAEVAQAKIVLLAVKPQQMEQVLQEIQFHLRHRPLLISIAAGIPIGWIEKRVGRSIPVVRVMPNTPALVGAGISAIAPGRAAKAKDLHVAKRIFACVGEVVEVPEKWMNSVTAVSGSGPAYFFFLMEQMIRAGVSLGLPSEVARRLVLGTATGAARLANISGEEPALLRSRVTSKGGTTEAAFRLFAQKDLGGILKRGIRAAAIRAKELTH